MHISLIATYCDVEWAQFGAQSADPLTVSALGNLRLEFIFRATCIPRF